MKRVAFIEEPEDEGATWLTRYRERRRREMTQLAQQIARNRIRHPERMREDLAEYARQGGRERERYDLMRELGRLGPNAPTWDEIHPPGIEYIPPGYETLDEWIAHLPEGMRQPPARVRRDGRGRRDWHGFPGKDGNYTRGR
jgi:hypothetical protein